LLTLLAANGIGTEEHLRWHLSYTRALAHYHAIMINEGHLMDWLDERHSQAAREQRRLHRRAEAYLGRLGA
jgi:hypothetical protein